MTSRDHDGSTWSDLAGGPSSLCHHRRSDPTSACPAGAAGQLHERPSLYKIILGVIVSPSRLSAGLGETMQPAEVSAVTTTPEQPEQSAAEDDVPTEELAKRQGVGPITALDELAQPDLWESEQEYEDFLTDLYASRRSDVA